MPEFSFSSLLRAEYDDETNVLRLWFVETGGPYKFFMVPRRLFQGLCRAASKEDFYNEHIRDRFKMSD